MMKAPTVLLLLSFLGLTAAAESSVELTYSNFEEKTKGKTVFVKFFSPSCGHCQELAPTWDKMAREWKGHDQGLVGAVDCTVETTFCDEMNLKGLPTLMFGDPAAGGVILEEYGGEKTYEDLAQFAKDTLTKPICSPLNLDVCEETERKRMMYFLSLGVWELGSVIKDKEDAIQLAIDQFQSQFQSMQAEYDSLGTANEIQTAKIRSRMKMLKGIQKQRKGN